MRILIYKRTHIGDPDPEHGIFGEADCMGKVRGYEFDAVVGIGGISREPRAAGIARKLTWVGIGAHKWGDDPKKRLVTFVDHFWCPDKTGPYLNNIAPKLAVYIFDTNRRLFVRELRGKWPYSESDRDLEAIDQEIIKILALAESAGPSPFGGESVKRHVARQSRDIGQNGCGGPSVGPSAPIRPVCRAPVPRLRSC